MSISLIISLCVSISLIALLVAIKVVFTKKGITLDNASNKFTKFIYLLLRNYKVILTIACFIVGLTWWLMAEKPARSYIGLNSTAIVGLDGALTAILIWSRIIVISLLVTRAKIKSVKILDYFVRYFSPVVIVLSFIFYKQVNQFWFNSLTILDTVPVIEALYFSYLGITLVLVGAYWVDATPKFEKLCKTQVFLIIALFFGLYLAAIPSWMMQYLFGLGPSKYTLLNLSSDHRLMILSCIVYPIGFYFLLRNKPKDVKLAILIFIAIAQMINFTYRYYFSLLNHIYRFPWHLCNTMMYIIPLCLLFNFKKLFYFTYFINVLGAIFAILMPNYDPIPLFSDEHIYFWTNHIMAFGSPLLLVAINLFKKPKMKEIGWSIIVFTVYFLAMMFLNAYGNAYNLGLDFLFLNKVDIPSKIGQAGRDLFNILAYIDIGNGRRMVFHIAYNLVFYFVYIVLTFAMWYVYSAVFILSNKHKILFIRRQKIKMEQLALESQLNGRSKKEPMIENAGTSLSIINFSKKYKNSEVFAVKNANLEIKGGEIIGFIGPNGAGKSTTIKCIVGIHEATEGDIRVCGYDIKTQSVEAKSLIGFVPDHYALYEKLTGREYINFIADIYKVNKADRDSRIEYYVNLFKLTDAFDNEISTYSHGMKQKVATIASLIHNPKVWILDEPLTGLDPESIYQVKECMKNHAKNGNIVMFSSHIIDVVENLCDKVVLIKQGELGSLTSIEEIHKSSTLEEFYMNNIKGSSSKFKDLTLEKNN